MNNNDLSKSSATSPKASLNFPISQANQNHNPREDRGKSHAAPISSSLNNNNSLPELYKHNS